MQDLALRPARVLKPYGPIIEDPSLRRVSGTAAIELSATF
jgi:hypothetical protein